MMLLVVVVGKIDAVTGCCSIFGVANGARDEAAAVVDSGD